MDKLKLGLQDTQQFDNDEEKNNREENKSSFTHNIKTINFNNVIKNDNTIFNNNNPLKKNEQNSNLNNQFYDNLDDFDFNSHVNIKIFGLGGAGNNMVNHIAENTSINRNCLYAINTDFQFLKSLSKNLNRILIGRTITKGFGSGSDPEIGKKAALEDAEIIREKLQNTDLLFIVSGMGKGTGTGASPIVAQIAKEMNILTICVTNLPSITAEGKEIYEKGRKGLEELKKFADGVSVISNEKIISNTLNSHQEMTLRDSFRLANTYIANIVDELINLVNVATEINIDFNDVKTFFKQRCGFHINKFVLESNDNVKKQVIDNIKNVIYHDELNNSSNKAILNLKLNPNAPREVISIIREALEEVLENKEFSLSYAVDYSDEIDFASVTLLISSGNLDKTSNLFSQDKNEFIRNNQVDFNFDEEENVLSKSIGLEDLNLNNQNDESKLNINDSIDEYLTNELNDNEIRKTNMEMKKFIDVNNIDTGSIRYYDSEQTKIDNLVRNNSMDDDSNSKYVLFTSEINDHMHFVKEDFTALKKEFSETNSHFDNRQEVTITKQIKNNPNNNINSTSLNRFFTKTLGGLFTKEAKNNSKN